MLKLLLFQMWALLLFSLRLGECADCDEATSATIYSLLEVLESDPSVQQQVRQQGVTSMTGRSGQRQWGCVILVSALGPNTSFFLFWGTFIQLGDLLGQGP